MNEVKLNLKGWGEVYSEILWIDGNLYKIKFAPDENDLSKMITDIFHFREILNIQEIFIDNNLKVTKI